MEGLIFIAVVLGLALLATGWRFVHQLKRKRLLSTVIWSMHGGLAFLGFIVILLVYSNLHTYHRLTYEEVIADIYVRELSPQRYQVSLAYSDKDKDQHYFTLQGDQWQIDARILKWKSWANLIGLDSFYQLDRLSGRYVEIDQARRNPPSLFDLKNPSSGLNIWKLKQLYRDKIAFVDTLYGQSVFMPMTNGAHYQLSIGQAGLITRPINEAARASGL